MKKIYSVMVMCVAVLTSALFVSCDEDIVPTETVLSVIDEEVTPSYTSCAIACTFYTDATIEYASVQYSTTEDFARYNVTEMIPNSYSSDNKSYSVELTKLQANTTYYFRYEVNASLFTSSTADIVSEFQTLQTSIPVVTTTLVTNLSYTSATVNGQITFDGGSSITEYGIVYSTSHNPTISNTKIKSNICDSTGTFACEVKNLQVNTTYYARTYAKNAQGVAYGEDVMFKTLQTTAPILTTSVEDVSHTSAAINGQITSDGGSMVTEFGVVYSISHNPTISNTKIKGTTCDSTGLFTCKLSNLQNNSTYYARAYATNERGTAYGNEVSFTTWKVGEVNGHKYVDLGLSVKWATCNVGANKPEESGDYFAWGETKPKDYYDWSNYKWCEGSNYSLTKYCDDSDFAYSSSYVDKIYVLQLSDDAARANWGGNWRMPLKSELDELYNSCTWTSTTQNGTKGYRVTGKNGNSIFLPKAGYKYEGSLTSLGAYGYYWSSTVYPYYHSSYGHHTYPYQAYAYSADGEEQIARRHGLPIRPVCQ